MKNKDVKKIQLGGWSHNNYSDVRAAINRVDDSDDFAGSFKSRKRKGKQKYCAKLKGPHTFVEAEHKFAQLSFNILKCSACGREKYIWKRLTT